MSALDLLSSSIGKSIPVNVLSGEELNEYLQKIEKVAKELDELGDPLSTLLATTLRASARMMQKIEVFGSTAVSNRLFEVLALLNSGEKVSDPVARKVYSKAFAATAVVLSSLIFVNDGIDAIGNTYTRVLEAAKYIEFVKPPQVKMLPPPAMDDSPDR